MARQIIDIKDCTEFSQLLNVNPPATLRVATFSLIALTALAIAWTSVTEADLVVRANGRIRAAEETMHVFAAADMRMLGRATEVNLRDGDSVRAGQVLVRFDTSLLENEIAKLRRQLATSTEEVQRYAKLEAMIADEKGSALAKIDSEIRQANLALAINKQRQASLVKQASIDLKNAKTRLARSQQLEKSHAISQSDLEQAKSGHAQANERLYQAELPLAADALQALAQEKIVVQKTYAVRQTELATHRVVKRGEIEAAEKELESLLHRKENAIILAPVDGVVVAAEVEAGSVAQPGQPLFEIAPGGGIRFDLAVPSEEVGELRIGMPTRIKLDAFDHQEYGTLQGTVCFIAPDSTLDNSKSNRASYIVRVELPEKHLNDGQSEVALKLGLDGVADIVTDRETVLEIFLKKVRRSISFG